jgi:hypothetical protein
MERAIGAVVRRNVTAGYRATWAAGDEDDVDHGRHGMSHAWRQHLRYDQSNPGQLKTVR